METLNISVPVAPKKWKIPMKVWIGIAVSISGLLLFLYLRYRKKQKEAELLKEKETAEEKKVDTEKEETKEVESPKEEPIKATEVIEDVPDTQEFLNQALRQNLHLPALTFNPDWEVIPLLPQANTPVRFRIFNQTGQAPVDIALEKEAENIAWQVIANGLTTIQVPLNDATQLRAVIASFLQQVSPVIIETEAKETKQDEPEDTNTNE